MDYDRLGKYGSGSAIALKTLERSFNILRIMLQCASAFLL
jgi:hypothetical protein